MDSNWTKKDLTELIREEINRTWDQTPPEERLLNRQEAADLLGIKENTMAIWAMDGTGPAPTKIGRCVRYRQTVLYKYIRDNTMPRMNASINSKDKQNYES